MEQFLGYRFQKFYTAIISHSPCLQTFVCLFRRKFFFAFFFDHSTAREREREAEAREQKGNEKKPIFSFSDPYPWVSFQAGRRTRTSGNYHTK